MRRETKTSLHAVLGIVLLALGACGGPDEPAPPEMHYGLDECATCRMIVSEERHAAARVTRDSAERFDDLGCLVARVAERPSPGARVWVHGTEGWLDARQAVYVHQPDLSTPMGYGYRAYAPGDPALADVPPEERLDWGGLRAALETSAEP